MPATRSVRLTLTLVAAVLLGTILWNFYRNVERTNQLRDEMADSQLRAMTIVVPPEPALCSAVRSGDVTQVEGVLAKGGQVNVLCTARERTSSSTAMPSAVLGWSPASPLHVAIRNHHARIVRLLLAHGAIPDFIAGANMPGSTFTYTYTGSPLKLAIQELPEVVPDLLEHGADMRETLRRAILAHKRNIVEELLKHGAIVNSSRLPGEFKRLQVTTSPEGKVTVAELPAPANAVIDQDGNITSKIAQTSVDPVSPLITAVCYAPEFEAMLRKAGATIGPDVDNILADAIHFKRRDLLAKLLALGANVNGRGRDGETPLTQAMAHMPDVVPFLLAHGADPNGLNRFNETALVIATQAGDIATVRLMLAHGASVNLHHGLGHTALYWAKRKGRAQIIELLQKAGATEDV